MAGNYLAQMAKGVVYLSILTHLYHGHTLQLAQVGLHALAHERSAHVDDTIRLEIGIRLNQRQHLVKGGTATAGSQCFGQHGETRRQVFYYLIGDAALRHLTDNQHGALGMNGRRQMGCQIINIHMCR